LAGAKIYQNEKGEKWREKKRIKRLKKKKIKKKPQMRISTTSFLSSNFDS